MKKGQYFSVKALTDGKAEIFIDGDIVHDDWRYYDSETSAISFRNALNELGDVSSIDLHINSGGGDVFEAAAIYHMLKHHKAYVTAYPIFAASAATLPAMAADRVVIPSNGMLMIHNAWTRGIGNHNDLRKLADDLEKINNSTVKQAYLAKNPEMDEAELSRLMDEETWLSANEALEMGLADEVITAVQVAASITKDQLDRYENAPSALKDKPEKKDTWDMEKVAKSIQDMQASIEAMKAENKNPEKEPDPEPVKNAGVAGFFLNLN